MKRVIICCLLASLLESVVAQSDYQDIDVNQKKNDSRKIFEFSIYTGVNVTNFIGDVDAFGDTLNFITGFDFEKTYRSFIIPVGLSISVNPTRWLSLKTGALYAPKGMKYKDSFSIEGEEYGAHVVFKLNYIEIPTLIELSFKTSRDNRLYLNGGITPSYIVSSKMIVAVWTDPFDKEDETEDWDEVRPYELGYTLGLGIKNDFNYWGVQYEKGTKSVSTTGLNFINQTFSFILGVYF